jgi:hypothetical protein
MVGKGMLMGALIHHAGSLFDEIFDENTYNNRFKHTYIITHTY